MENRTEPMQEQAWWKLHCASCLLVFCAVVWCCWCWLRSEWGKKTSKPIHTHQNSQRKQTSFTVPTNLGKTLANIIYCMCLFQHVGKQDRTHVRTHMVKIAFRKLVAGILCGCVVLLVVCEVSDEKNIQTYPYSNCTFHQENSQRVQTSFTVPTNLGKTLANIIHCMVPFSMLENRTEPMQEQAWWKLHCASCLLVFCAVVWCCWCWLRSECGKKTKPIHILTALFTTRIHKENKQVLPYQPTSGKLWPT